MRNLWLWIIVLFWGGVIYYFGGAGFGRAKTQALIDRFRKNPAIWNFLDRHHGKFRAAFHYFEFGLCFFILYLAVTAGSLEWSYLRGLGVWLVTGILAFLDELHQKRTGGRCFRRIDLFHSLLGDTLVMLLVFLGNL